MRHVHDHHLDLVPLLAAEAREASGKVPALAPWQDTYDSALFGVGQNALELPGLGITPELVNREDLGKPSRSPTARYPNNLAVVAEMLQRRATLFMETAEANSPMMKAMSSEDMRR